MPRSVPEWIGKTHDTQIPPRVKLRIFERYFGKCCGCGLKVVGRPAYDHHIALANGGENRESNIRLLCERCHGDKTKTDVHIKATIQKKKKKRLKLGRSRPIPGSKGSGYRKKLDGTVIKVDE